MSTLRNPSEDFGTLLKVLKRSPSENVRDEQKILADLRVAITGGTSGLGLALAKEFSARGAKVAFVARNRERVAEVAKDLLTAEGIVGDVSRKEDIYPIALQINGLLGGVDVLINNASSLGPVPLALLADTQCGDFALALETNVLGPFRLTKALLGSLAASARDGRTPLILNIGSDAGTTPYAKWGAYGTSKAALHHMSRIWDEELQALGIRVLSMDPGDMDTPMHMLANPEADRSSLKTPEQSAREILTQVLAFRATDRERVESRTA